MLSVISSLLLTYSGGGGCISICHAAFVASPLNIAPHYHEQKQYFRHLPRLLKLNAEQPNGNNALVNSSFNDDESTLSAAEELSSSTLTTTTKATTKSKPPPPLPIEFDPTNPEALIAITKSFIASDFGIQRQTTSSSSSQPVRHFLSSIILHTLVCG